MLQKRRKVFNYFFRGIKKTLVTILYYFFWGIRNTFWGNNLDI
jgi:hypothetical protein